MDHLQYIPDYGIINIKNMSKNTSIILGEHFDKFIQREIKSERYSSASEIIRSGLRLLEIENQKIKAINKALVIGEQSGSPIKFDNEKFNKKMRAKFKINASS